VRVFACDLDRTLIAEDAVLRPRTLGAIHAAREAGIRVLIATGRMYRSVRPYLEQAGIDDPVVCYQGAAAIDPRTGEFLLHVPIPLELAREIIAAVDETGHHLNVYVDDELYVESITPEARDYADFQSIPLHPVGPLLEWIEKPPTKLVAVGTPAETSALKERMRARFGDRLYIVTSLPIFLEFASPEVTKGSGIAFVAEHLGFTAGETVAFGDGENDVELIEWAGYGVAVANAHPRALEAADFVAPRDVEEGVAQVIEAYLESRA
jgi:Cof subfamily protein (haloacid dehalogenase superfamily)